MDFRRGFSVRGSSRPPDITIGHAELSRTRTRTGLAPTPMGHVRVVHVHVHKPRPGHYQ
jgi:hypothetical protein